VAHWKVLLTPAIERSSLDVLAAGGTPKLQALGLLNGTVYRWNRPCYGITEGRPHLRIEFRCLPSGPTIIDEIANAAFWLGLMHDRPEEYRGIAHRMDFDEARNNLLKAARYGLDAQLSWLDGRTVAPRTLLLEELLPAARRGLASAGVAEEDIARYLDIVAARVESGRTGSQWILDAHASLRGRTSSARALDVITEGIYRRQKAGLPVHRWSGLDASEIGEQPQRYERVEELMSTNLITVREDDLAELINSLMCWSRIHHVPVENPAGEVVGVVTAEMLLTRSTGHVSTPLLARDVMDCEPAIVNPEMDAREALTLLRAGERDCLLVVSAGKLVGIVTERDYLKLAACALEAGRDGAPPAERTR
jgi:CBS domain-containing protein